MSETQVIPAITIPVTELELLQAELRATKDEYKKLYKDYVELHYEVKRLKSAMGLVDE